MQQWIIFAIIAMIVFSFSNLALKTITGKVDFNAFKPLLFPAALAILVFVLGALYVFNKQPFPISNQLLLLIAGVIVCSIVGFILFLKADDGSVTHLDLGGNSTRCSGGMMAATLSATMPIVDIRRQSFVVPRLTSGRAARNSTNETLRYERRF